MAVDSTHRIVAAAERQNAAQLSRSGRPFAATVISASPTTENMKVVSNIAGEIDGRVVHPYVGRNHWHRIGPDPGQRVLVAMRMDTREPVITGYLSASARDDTPARRLAAYDVGKDLYRPLEIGEQEIVSSGIAQTFWSRRGVLDQRGGYVRQWLDQDSLESGARAVTHVRELHLNQSAITGDEERFGGVTRPDAQSKVFRKFIDAPASTSIPQNPQVNASEASDPESLAASTAGAADQTEPAKEYMYVLKSASSTVIDHREGHVVDDTGELLEGKFGNKLRFRKKIFGQQSGDAASGVASQATTAGTGSETYEQQVDDSGNMYIGLPSTASEGIKFEIPSGKFTVKAGTASSSLELDGTQNTFNMKSTQDGVIRAESGLKVHSAQVKIGLTEAAIHKSYKTLTKKAAQATLHGGLLGMGTADGTLNTALSVAAGALTAVNAAAMACPLCPGVVVGLLGMAHGALPSIFHATNGILKIAKGGLSGAYAAGQDTHESNTVSISD